MNRRDFTFLTLLSASLAACTPLSRSLKPDTTPSKPLIGLVLGGGAGRGFAHIGVIKALETHHISPDLIVGCSAGSIVGALYASGLSAFDLQTLASRLDESMFADWSGFDRGLLKGEAIETFVNREIHHQPIETLKRRFAAVATDLTTGKPEIFTTGNTGTAVRASASIPGIFAPVNLNGREFVDGGLSSPIPVQAARELGANIVIAVDISARPSGKKRASTAEVLLDTIAIMGSTLGAYELKHADIVIQPQVQNLSATSFQQRNEAILEGERAGFAAIALIREKLARKALT